MLDDRTVISRCLAGQHTLFDVLVDRYKNPLYSFCRKLTGNRNDADDLFQDTWSKAFRNIGYYDTERPFLNWIFSICINLYRDGLRKYSRWLKLMKSHLTGEQKDTEMKNVESNERKPEEQALRSEREQAVRNALSMLKDRIRIPLILYYYRRFTVIEISEMLNIPVGTVKSRLATGRNRLKSLMEVQDDYGK